MKYPRDILKVQRIYELEQNDKIGFGIIGFIDVERSSIYRLIFWLFSQKKTNKYRFDNYLGRGYEGIAKVLGISGIEACELLIRKLELALTLDFGTIINEAIKGKLKVMNKKLRIEKFREKQREAVLKNG